MICKLSASSQNFIRVLDHGSFAMNHLLYLDMGMLPFNPFQISMTEKLFLIPQCYQFCCFAITFIVNCRHLQAIQDSPLSMFLINTILSVPSFKFFDRKAPAHRAVNNFMPCRQTACYPLAALTVSILGFWMLRKDICFTEKHLSTLTASFMVAANLLRHGLICCQNAGREWFIHLAGVLLGVTTRANLVMFSHPIISLIWLIWPVIYGRKQAFR